MRFLFNSFEIPVTINGEIIYFVIDTGASCSFMSPPQLRNIDIRNSEQYNDYIMYGEVIRTPAQDFKLTIEIGNKKFEDVDFVYSTDERYYSAINTEKNLKFVALSNNLGLAFFENHIIQFDFKNMVFRIK